MYSTPGISQSSFSIGWVARFSTSLAVIPGACTITSIIGTMICGSSSRGRLMVAKTPAARAAMMIRGVSLLSMKAEATRPAKP